MRTAGFFFASLLGSLALLAATTARPAAAADEAGFKAMFDGKSLEGWDGNPKFWKVEDGCIVGQTTKDEPTKSNTFLIWRGGTPGDFELKAEFRMPGNPDVEPGKDFANSGIQYRSWEGKEKWRVSGYQADMDLHNGYTGMCYGEGFRGFLAPRGQKTVVGTDHKPKVVGSVGDPKELASFVKSRDWNEYRIVAKGNHFTHEINGHLMCELTDEDTQARKDGIIALQLHAGPPMKVQFRNVRIKEFKHDNLMKADAAKKIVFIAGARSHGYAEHEHYAGCALLAKWIKDNVPGVETVVHQGWPKEDSALDGAATIVIFSDGGGGHPAMPHLKQLDKLMKQGVGLVCLHYAVEIPKGEPGDLLKSWIGGYFETFWSVNPHWTAKYTKLPDHPVARGVKPFTISDEWYYHMRFVDDMKGVTPILTAVPPDDTHRKGNDAHGANPVVFARKGQPEHLAWACQRDDGGRGFGFTGCHFHLSWAHDSFRKVVLNGIVWTAGIEVPAAGVPSKTPTLDELLTNIDKPQPAKFDKAAAQKLIDSFKAEPK